jgi:hypothetical protein
MNIGLLPNHGSSVLEPHTDIPIQSYLRDNVLSLLQSNDGDCGRFASALLKEANKLFNTGKKPTVDNIMDAFDMIGMQGGFISKHTSINTVEGDVFLSGKVKGVLQGKVVLLPWKTVGRPPTIKDVEAGEANTAFSALHETFHLAKAGHFSDEQLAKAALSVNEEPYPDYSSEQIFDWSATFDKELLKHCKKGGGSGK